MAALDWFFVAILLASMLIGAWRGLVFEVLSLAGWVVAFFVAQWFAADMAVWLPLGDADSSLRYAAGFILVFVLAVFACGFFAWLAKRLVDSMGMRPVDRALGAAFGVLRSVLLLLVVTVVADLTALHDMPWWQESLGAHWLSEALTGLKPVLPAEFGRHLPS